MARHRTYSLEFKGQVAQHYLSREIALERPVGTSSGQNRVWHDYAPYNPRMLEKYLTIFRSTHNFVFVGTDGKTPAMRLGFARQPLRFEDILWPGQRIPRPKRSRRKGRALAA